MKLLSEIKKNVRILLDHNEEADSIADFGEDQLKLDDIIENQVEAGARLTLQLAPRRYLGWVKWEAEEDLSENSETTETSETYFSLPLPSDYIRFGAVKMSSWKKAVNTLLEASDEEYAMQQSEFPGIRATLRKPLAFIIEGEDGNELQLYPLAENDTLEYFTYCRQPKITEQDCAEAIDVSDTLYEPFIYITSALVAEVLKDTDKSNELMTGAKMMLTEPDEISAATTQAAANGQT